MIVTPRAFVFTDLAGSTALAARLGDRRFAALIRDHNLLLRSLLARHRGEEAGFLGDGFFMSFAHPDDALDWAVAVQRRAPEVLGDAAPLCVGIHAGGAVAEGTSWVGRDVIVARRLCEQAAPGEILVSLRMRALARRHALGSFAPAEALSLKGLPGSHPACAIAWR